MLFQDCADAPELGLFFVQSPYFQPAMDGSASGIAFLISADGLAATCAHVAIVVDALPGDTMSLRGASHELPIVLDAEVLERGWCGPDPEELRAAAKARGVPIATFFASRFDHMREDLALLRLKLETARLDLTRVRQSEADASQLLIERARVLPMAAAGYRHASGTPLKAWHVVYTAGTDDRLGPSLSPGDARFRASEPRLHNAIRFDTKDVRPGYSGSPLWDVQRSRVVGMVRRGIKNAVPDNVLGTAAREIADLADVTLKPDLAAITLLQVLAHAAEYLAPMRHFPMTHALLPKRLHELHVRLAVPRDPLSETIQQRRPATAELIATACREAVVVLRGSAGAGKSTALLQVARHLLEHEVVADGRRLVPLMIQAVDFRVLGFDLSALLREPTRRADIQGPDEQTLAEALELNDLTLLLLIDGLDELPPPESAKVISYLTSVKPSSKRVRVIVATRPIDLARTDATGRTRQNWPVLEVAHLEDGEVDEFMQSYVPEKTKRSATLQLLTEVHWDRSGPTPLQLTTAAAVLAFSGGLPERAIDLPFALLDHLLLNGLQEARKVDESRGFAARSASDAELAKPERLRAVLGAVAHAWFYGASDGADLVRQAARGSDGIIEDGPGVVAFLQREVQLVGGLLAWVDDKPLWLHRTVAEALAAEHLARIGEVRPEGTATLIQEAVRKSRSFALTTMAASDRTHSGRVAVARALDRLLESGGGNYALAYVAVQALGAGIRINDELRRRLVRMLITLLLMPPGMSVGAVNCAEVFSTDSVPPPANLAQRPMVRAAIVDQLHERWRQRDPRRRGSKEPLVVSARDAALLDLLDMWAEIEIPVTRPPVRAAWLKLGGGTPSIARPSTKQDKASESMVATAALSYALGRLRADADGFLEGFVQFARTAGVDLQADEAARAYVAAELTRSAILRRLEGEDP